MKNNLAEVSTIPEENFFFFRSRCVLCVTMMGRKTRLNRFSIKGLCFFNIIAFSYTPEYQTPLTYYPEARRSSEFMYCISKNPPTRYCIEQLFKIAACIHIGSQIYTYFSLLLRYVYKYILFGATEGKASLLNVHRTT